MRKNPVCAYIYICLHTRLLDNINVPEDPMTTLSNPFRFEESVRRVHAKAEITGGQNSA